MKPVYACHKCGFVSTIWGEFESVSTVEGGPCTCKACATDALCDPQPGDKYEHQDGGTVYIFFRDTPQAIWISRRPFGKAQRKVNVKAWTRMVQNGEIRRKL